MYDNQVLKNYLKDRNYDECISILKEKIVSFVINKIKKILKDEITVITGQSGVGKSTLLNHLDSSLTLKTNEISQALGYNMK